MVILTLNSCRTPRGEGWGGGAVINKPPPVNSDCNGRCLIAAGWSPASVSARGSLTPTRVGDSHAAFILTFQLKQLAQLKLRFAS